MVKSYFVYIIECKNGSYYTGYTTDIERRYAEHLDGSIKCKYTRANPPKRLAASWAFQATLSDILRIEKAIKKLNKQKKQALVKSQNMIHEIIHRLEISDVTQ